MITCKADIVIRQYDGRPRPVVNVKIRGGADRFDYRVDQAIADGRDAMYPEATAGDYSATWIREHVDEGRASDLWDRAIQDGWRQLDIAAEEIYGPGADVLSTGRSGGWAFIGGFTADDVRAWDAIMVQKWARFDRACTDACRGLHAEFARLVYELEYQPMAEARDKARRAIIGRATFIGAAVASLTGGAQ